MDAEKITYPDDLREGDIFLGPIGGLTGIGVRLGQLMLGEGYRTGRLHIEHVAMCVKAGEWPAPPVIAQAMPMGAETVKFRWDRHWTEACAWVRLPEMYPLQCLDAAAVALAMVREKVGYSFLSYPALAGVKLGLEGGALERWVSRQYGVRVPGTSVPTRAEGDIFAIPHRAICSRLVDAAWTATGYEVLERTRPGVATPGMMADQFTSREGVTWARPLGKKLPAKSWTV